MTINWLMALVAIPIVVVFLALVAMIVFKATENEYVLNNIEGLLAAVAVIGVIVSQVVGGIIRKWVGGE